MPHIERRFLRTKTVRDIICFTEDGEEVDQGRSYFFARLVDISKGGAGLETGQHCEAEGEISLQGLDTFSEVVVGKVRWIKQSGQKYNIGLQFTSH